MAGLVLLWAADAVRNAGEDRKPGGQPTLPSSLEEESENIRLRSLIDNAAHLLVFSGWFILCRSDVSECTNTYL